MRSNEQIEFSNIPARKISRTLYAKAISAFLRCDIDTLVKCVVGGVDLADFTVLKLTPDAICDFKNSTQQWSNAKIISVEGHKVTLQSANRPANWCETIDWYEQPDRFASANSLSQPATGRAIGFLPELFRLTLLTKSANKWRFIQAFLQRDVGQQISDSTFIKSLLNQAIAGHVSFNLVKFLYAKLPAPVLPAVDILSLSLQVKTNKNWLILLKDFQYTPLTKPYRHIMLRRALKLKLHQDIVSLLEPPRQDLQISLGISIKKQDWNFAIDLLHRTRILAPLSAPRKQVVMDLIIYCELRLKEALAEHSFHSFSFWKKHLSSFDADTKLTAAFHLIYYMLTNVLLPASAHHFAALEEGRLARHFDACCKVAPQCYEAFSHSSLIQQLRQPPTVSVLRMMRV